MPGYWKKPVSRTYQYNLDVAEHYYSPMTDYLDSKSGIRSETPGPLTYSERLARKWIRGRNYDPLYLREKYSRSGSAARTDEKTHLRTRASSELASGSVENVLRNKKVNSSCSTKLSSSSIKKEFEATNKSCSSYFSSSLIKSGSKYVDTDDICKKVADVRMMPWTEGAERDAAMKASNLTRSRISELDNELDEIIRKAMTTRISSLKTASQMASQAMKEDEDSMVSSYKRTKKVMTQTKNVFKS